MIFVVLINLVPIVVLILLAKALVRTRATLLFGTLRIDRSTAPTTYWIVVACLAVVLLITASVAVFIDTALIRRGGLS